MNIVWFSWKDSYHPAAGGAETISWAIMTRLVASGHQVRLITSRYAGGSDRQTVDGVEIYRVGNKFSVYAQAAALFRRTMKGWPDVAIDEMNTIPFGSAYYSGARNILLTYQLAREVWFYQMAHPLSYVGYGLEPFYLKQLIRKYPLVLTESESTRADLGRFGFDVNNIGVFRVGIELKPATHLTAKSGNLILVLGAIRPMKRTLDAIKAFEIARDKRPELTLTVAGNDTGPYADKVKAYVGTSRHRGAITIAGRVSIAEKLALMQQAAAIVVTSIKEGWGLIVTEAASQGTPAVAYDCDGLRDSIINGKTGMLAPSGDYSALGNALLDLLKDDTTYQRIRQEAWRNSQQYTFENCYADFLRLTGIPDKA